MKKVYKIFKIEHRSWSSYSGSSEDGFLLKPFRDIKGNTVDRMFTTEEEAIKCLEKNCDDSEQCIIQPIIVK